MAVQVARLGLDCRSCTDDDKRNYGCDAPPSDPARWQFEGGFLDRCPIRLLKPESMQYIKVFGYYKEGYLFNEGTIAHQPAKLLEAFSIIENENDRLNREAEENE